jgi:glycosyltransferase involved in cell wall biosynthesis
MKWFLPERTKFIPYACTNILDLAPNFQIASENSFKVCHAPSDRDVKGTSFILNAVEKLQRDGYAIELQILENLSHDIVLERISDCDVFIDQLHHGWYGGVAVEAMALGKPVICYIREKDLIYVSEMMVSDLPIIRSNPDLIYETLRTLLSQSHSSLVQIGRDSRRFVEFWHDPMKITGEILSIYRDSIESKKLLSTRRSS